MSFIDPNDFEVVALDTAGEIGGAYLASEGLHLIAPKDWTPEQYKTMVETIVAGYIDNLQDQNDQAIRAVQKVTSFPPLGAGEYRSFNTENVDGNFPS